jgi:2-polyprenyl-3-methyl-5-hydroxy-6-metoxy-1,4-benzoquinol methylase
MGSRMLTRMGALKGGMPLYKFAGNRILTWIENRLLRSNLSEFHSGYRLYSVRALKAIPFERNSNGFHFDTEIIIQLLIARFTLTELPIPTYYGDEVCYVNGLKYAWNVVAAVLKARLQELGLFYDRRFDCAPADAASPYMLKLGYTSPHSVALERVRAGSRVLDLGCAGGYLASVLRRQKRCFVSGIDMAPAAEGSVDEFRIHDLNSGIPDFRADDYDVVLMLDVIEHLAKPEDFLEQLRQKLAHNISTELIVSTANVASFFTRLMLMLGQFNYGRRGILDLTHTRLFTFASLRRTLDQAGFTIVETKGIPAPYPLAIGNNMLSRMLLRVNELLIRLSRGLFAYQIYIRAKPQPTVESLLNSARAESKIRSELIDRVGVDDVAAFQAVLRNAVAAVPGTR